MNTTKWVLPIALAGALAGVADENKLGMGEPPVQAAKPAPTVGKDGRIVLQYGPLQRGRRTDAAMEKWRDNRFGQFIHFGLYAVPGGIWKGKTYSYAAEFLRGSAGVSDAEWATLRDQFKLEHFDAKAWAAMAKAMGVRYMAITAKHHEGFCLWPSQYTDFDIETTPFHRDLIGELVDAYTAEGLDVYLYYSVLDWHHPGWRSDLKSPADEAAFEELKAFTRNQLLELQDRYPAVKGFWFDGTWDKSWQKNGKFSYELEKEFKARRPGFIVNSRLRADDFGKRHFDSNHDLMGDYESGWERRIPDPCRNPEVLARDWECCMTMPENQWGYHQDWTVSYLKESNELIEMLAHCTAMNGNFLLNFGPKADGTFREEEQVRAREIGEWMEVNGEAIYGCGASSMPKQDWGWITRNRKSGQEYLIVCNVPVSGLLKVQWSGEKELATATQLGGTALESRKYDSRSACVVLKDRTPARPVVVALSFREVK